MLASDLHRLDRCLQAIANACIPTMRAICARRAESAQHILGIYSVAVDLAHHFSEFAI